MQPSLSSVPARRHARRSGLTLLLLALATVHAASAGLVLDPFGSEAAALLARDGASSSGSGVSDAAASTFGTPSWATQPDGGPPLTGSDASAQAALSAAASAVHAAETPTPSKRQLPQLQSEDAQDYRRAASDPLAALSLRSHHRKHAHRHRHARHSKDTSSDARAHNLLAAPVGGSGSGDGSGSGSGSDSAPSTGASGRGKVLTSSGMLTWYAGNQLLNPACGGPAPTDGSLVGAVSESSSQIGSCGDRVRISKGGSSVVVTIRDYCASCGPEHMDLTKSAFAQIAPLVQGVVKGVTMTKLGASDA